MTFKELRTLIKSESKKAGNSFENSTDIIREKVFDLDKESVKKILLEIGAIPEDIEHDSSEEKIYSKATDIILAKSLQELGLKAVVNKERADCADVVGKSNIHNYSLVGDAKAFRLSRTAKNQKDFKVKSMADWRGDHDYALLVCPYFQYPKKNSQIYGQALDENVCLISWEHLSFFLESGVCESKSLNLSSIWNISNKIGEDVTIKDKHKKANFHDKGNRLICDYLSIKYEHFNDYFNSSRSIIIRRGKNEISHWEKYLMKIDKYSKEKAVEELKKALKIEDKINSINKFIDGLRV